MNIQYNMNKLITDYVFTLSDNGLESIAYDKIQPQAGFFSLDLNLGGHTTDALKALSDSTNKLCDEGISFNINIPLLDNVKNWLKKIHSLLPEGSFIAVSAVTILGIAVLDFNRGTSYSIVLASFLAGYLAKGLVQPQSGFVDSLADVLGALFATWFSTTALSAKSFVDSCIKGAKVGLVLKSFSNVFTHCLDKLQQWLGLEIHLPWNRTGLLVLDEYLFRAENMISEYKSQSRPITEELYCSFIMAMREGKKIMNTIPGGGDTAGWRVNLVNTISNLHKIVDHMSNTSFRERGARIEPVSLLMMGPPGVGKSVSIDWFVSALLATVLDKEQLEAFKENPEPFIYNRQAENKYWDGYDIHKIVCLYDDICQQRDVAGDPDNEVMGIIRNVNTFENQLHTAAIDGKGNTLFRSKFVFATSNVTRFSFVSINEPGAWARRWDFPVMPVVKAAYALFDNNGVRLNKFDESKLPKDSNGSTVLSPEICDWHLCAWDDKSHTFIQTDVVYSFRQLVLKMREKYNLKSRRHFVQKENIKNIIEQYSLYNPDLVEESNTTKASASRFNAGGGGETLFVMPQCGEKNFSCLWQHNFNQLDFDKTICDYFEDDSEDIKRFNDCYSRLSLSCSAVSEEQHVRNYFMNELCSHCDKGLDHDEFDCTSLSVKGFLSYIGEQSQSELDLLEVDRSLNSPLPDEPVGVIDMVWLSCYLTVNSTMDRLQKYIEWVRDTSKRHHSVALAGFLATFVGVGYLIRYTDVISNLADLLFGKTVYEPTPESSDRNLRPAKSKGRSLVSRPYITSQGGVGQDMLNRINKVVLRNVLRMTLITQDEEIHLGYCLGVKGQVAICPLHILLILTNQLIDGLINPSDQVHFYWAGGDKLRFKMDASSFRDQSWLSEEMDKGDLISFIAPNFVLFTDISKHFVKEDDINMMKFSSVLLPIAGKEVVVHSTQATRERTALSVNESAHLEAYEVSSTWRYAAPTDKGDCGSVLFINNPAVSRKIAGLHVAGDSRYGWSTVLTRELVDEIVKRWDGFGFDLVETSPVDDVILGDVEAESGFLRTRNVDEDLALSFKGLLPRNLTPNLPRESKIVRSPLWNKLRPVTKDVARLKSWTDAGGSRRDPLFDGLKEYKPEKVYIDPFKLELAVGSEIDFLRNNSDIPVVNEVYPFEVACLGHPSDTDFGSLARSTSIGWPYVCEPGPKTKAKFFGNGEEFDLDNDQALRLRSHVEDVISSARRGKRSLHIFTDFLKDERLSLKKVEAGRSRIISGAPLPLVVASRMYFGAFMLHMAKNCIVNGTAIGLNPYADGWAALTRHLFRHGVGLNNIGAGDYKGFDKTHVPQLQWAVLDVIESFYIDATPEDSLVRSVLWRELVNSIHVSDGGIFEWNGSLPSGHPLTSIVNCIYNHLLMRLCFSDFSLARGLSLEESFTTFDKHVVLVVLGDDNIYSVSQVCVGFTEAYIATAMTRYGATYTTDTKAETEEGASLRRLEDCTFLKRHFILKSDFDGSPCGALAIETIYDMVCWMKKSPTMEQNFSSTVQEALIECSAHPAREFKKFVHSLNSEIQNQGLKLDLVTSRRQLVTMYRKNDKFV